MDKVVYERCYDNQDIQNDGDFCEMNDIKLHDQFDEDLLKREKQEVNDVNWEFGEETIQDIINDKDIKFTVIEPDDTVCYEVLINQLSNVKINNEDIKIDTTELDERFRIVDPVYPEVFDEQLRNINDGSIKFTVTEPDEINITEK